MIISYNVPKDLIAFFKDKSEDEINRFITEAIQVQSSLDNLTALCLDIRLNLNSTSAISTPVKEIKEIKPQPQRSIDSEEQDDIDDFMSSFIK